jgi:hypothetical protein
MINAIDQIAFHSVEKNIVKFYAKSTVDTKRDGKRVYLTDDNREIVDPVYAKPIGVLTPNEVKIYMEVSQTMHEEQMALWGEIAGRFRSWNEQWELYPQYTSEQPKSVEMFLLDLNEKYKLTRRQ